MTDLVGHIIDERLVHTVFQPLVHLTDGEVVGYEALARGPTGSPLEPPLALQQAATAANRLAALDWLCAATAARSVAQARLHPSQTLFLNMEPTTLLTSCPEALMRDFQRADRLRVVVELAEASLTGDPSSVLEAVHAVRDQVWGIALDGVGAQPASTAFLPVLYPDVVKLDIPGLRARNQSELARIETAVRAYAERTGAMILAQRIESGEDAAWALALGATYGQGWHYGHPGELPAETRAPAAPFPLLRTPETKVGATPFDVVSEHRHSTAIDRRFLCEISRLLELEVLSSRDSCVLLASIERQEHLTAAVEARYRLLGERGVFTVVCGEGMGDSDPGLRTVTLRPGDPLAKEWDVVVVGPHYCGALVARDLGDLGPEGFRRYEYVLTHDWTLVVAAARSMLRWVTQQHPVHAGGVDRRTA